MSLTPQPSKTLVAWAVVGETEFHRFEERCLTERAPGCRRIYKADDVDAEIERLTRELTIQKAVVDLAYVPHRSLVESRDGLQKRYDRLRAQFDEVLEFMDKRCVGAGASADGARWDLLARMRGAEHSESETLPRTGAYAPSATCRHGVHPYDCRQGCNPQPPEKCTNPFCTDGQTAEGPCLRCGGTGSLPQATPLPSNTLLPQLRDTADRLLAAANGSGLGLSSANARLMRGASALMNAAASALSGAPTAPETKPDYPKLYMRCHTHKDWPHAAMSFTTNAAAVHSVIVCPICEQERTASKARVRIPVCPECGQPSCACGQGQL